MFRCWIIPVFAAMIATPALAQDSADDAEFLVDIERQERLDEAVLAVDRLLDTVLDMPVGQLAEALPSETLGDARVREGDTVRDLGSRTDPAFEENVRGGARAMTAVLGNMMQEFAAKAVELGAESSQLEDQ